MAAHDQSGRPIADGDHTDAERCRPGRQRRTWWYDWVDGTTGGGIALVGVIATQIGTYFGYVFPAIGLPTLPWPLYNGGTSPTA